MSEHEAAEDVAQVGDFARLDLARLRRTGMAETVYCAGKTPEQAAAIFAAFARSGQAALGTRCSAEVGAAVVAAVPGVRYGAAGRTLELAVAMRPGSGGGAQLRRPVGGPPVCPAGLSLSGCFDLLGRKIEKRIPPG